MKLFALAFPLVASLAFAQKQEGVRYPMKEAMIANFLQSTGITVTSSQVHLPMIVTAITPEPQLEIMAAQRVNKGEMRFELHCRGSAECLPFDALVDNADTPGFGRAVDIKSRPDGSVAEVGQGNKTGKKILYTKREDGTPIHVRVGARVMLLIEEGPMQIHVPAVAIDSGSAGEVVRVCLVNRKKVIRAQVIDRGVVSGVIE